MSVNQCANASTPGEAGVGPAHRSGWVRPIRSRAAPLALALFALASVAIRIHQTGKIATPFHLCDEFIYAGVARNVAAGGGFQWRGQDLLINPLYSALISPAWSLPTLAGAYALAKALNVVLMTLAAIPFYRWARRCLSPWWAAGVTAIMLLLPEFAYAGMILSENAFFPTFILALFAIASALECPTVRRQAGALLAIGLSCLARQQGLVLLAILPTAIGLHAALAPADSATRRSAGFFVRGCRRHILSLGALALLGAAYAALCLILDRPLSTALGSYRLVATSGYPLWSVPRLAGLHLVWLATTVGFVPVSALAILWTRVARSSCGLNAAERAFLAVTTSALVWLLLQVAVFTSRFAGGVVGRYTFYLAPPLLLAGAIWMAGGLPVPRVVGLAAGVLPVATVLALPVPVFRMTIFPNVLLPVALIAERLPGDHAARAVLVAWGLAAGSCFIGAPRRAVRILLPASLSALFVVTGWIATAAMQAQSQRVRNGPVQGTNPGWVDAVLGADHRAAFLYSASGDAWRASLRMLELEFWNRTIDRVLDYRDDEICTLPALRVDLEEATGRIVSGPSSPGGATPSPLAGSESEFVVADAALEVVGDRVAECPPYSLYRIHPPLLLQSGTRGVFADGWMGSEAAYWRYPSAGRCSGQVEVRLSRRRLGSNDPGDVRIEVRRLAPVDEGLSGPLVSTETGTIESGGRRTFVVSTPSPPFQAVVHVWPTSSAGADDPRQLGARVSFRFLPIACPAPPP